jgi:hypothetical protein
MIRDKKWRKAMLKAIRKSARETSLFKGTTLTNGLRCIRTFERVNGVAFNPFDSYHCSLVDGMAVHEAIHRKLRLMGERHGLQGKPRQDETQGRGQA